MGNFRMIAPVVSGLNGLNHLMTGSGLARNARQYWNLTEHDDKVDKKESKKIS